LPSLNDLFYSDFYIESRVDDFAAFSALSAVKF